MFHPQTITMRRTPNLDDQVLFALMQTKSHIRNTAYRQFELPFRKAMQDFAPAAKMPHASLYRQSFDQLLNKGKRACFAGETTILSRLIQEAESIVAISEVKRSKLAGLGHYHAGTVLVQLLAKKDPTAFDQIIHAYRNPILSVLCHQFNHIQAFHEEVLSDTLMTLRQNARAGKITLPLRSQLFTYACSIAKNKLKKFLRTYQKGRSYEDLSQAASTPAEPWRENGSTYLAYVQARHPEFERLMGPEGLTFDNLVRHLEPMARTILRLRFYENLSHREIGKRLNIKEGTSRKRLMDSLRKWRKCYLETDDTADTGHPSVTQERVLYHLRTLGAKRDTEAWEEPLRAWSQHGLQPGPRSIPA